MSMQALRERLAAINKDAKNLLADKGSATWSKDDQTTFDNLMEEAERTQRQLENHQKVLDMEAEKHFRDVPRNENGQPTEKTEARKGVELFLRRMTNQITPEEAIIAIRNTMSTSTGSQGGYTVQTEVAKEVIDYLKDYGAMRRAADRLVTSTGVDLSYPASDGTSETGEIVTQNSAATGADMTFATVPLNTFKFGSKKIAIPIELLQDTNVDILALVNKRIRDRIGRLANTKFTIGSGTGEPKGVSVAASVGKTGTTGQTLTIIYDDLVDVMDSLDVAYQVEGCQWQFSQALRKVLRKIKDTQGRPIWTPNYDGGIAGGYSDELLGFPVNINNDMATPAANAISLAFGNFKQYMIRDAMEVTLFRFEDSAFMANGQVGFLAWARMGGNLLDVNSIKTYQHSAT
jgi:HK97 family phage major capsid protein